MSVPRPSHSVQELFGSSADRYDQRHYGSRYRTFIGDRQQLLNSVLASMPLSRSVRVLDVACGPGRFLDAAIAGGATTTGIDRSQDMLRTSAKRLGTRSRLVLGDATSLPFDSCSFDLVNCSGLIEYFSDPTVLLREIYRVLSPGGSAMVSSTNRRSPALSLQFLIHGIRKSRFLHSLLKKSGAMVDQVSLRERNFRMTFHTPAELETILATTGFEDVRMHFFHLQLVPHPFDRIAPGLTTACVKMTDRLLPKSPMRRLSEGMVAIGTRAS